MEARHKAGHDGLRLRYCFFAPFLPPASGKIHMATTKKIAVNKTNLSNSGRTGEPLQGASKSATSQR